MFDGVFFLPGTQKAFVARFRAAARARPLTGPFAAPVFRGTETSGSDRHAGEARTAAVTQTILNAAASAARGREILLAPDSDNELGCTEATTALETLHALVCNAYTDPAATQQQKQD